MTAPRKRGPGRPPGSAPPLPPMDERLVQRYVSGELNTLDMSALSGWPRHRVARLLRDRGLLRTRQQAGAARRRWRNRERTAEALRLRAEGLTLAEIGRRLGVSGSRAHQIIRDAGGV